MNTKALEPITRIYERLTSIERYLGVPKAPAHKTKHLQTAIREAAGLWSKHPRTAADQKNVRSRLGYD